MNIDINMVRLLGVAQLAVFAASMLSERLLVSVVGSGDSPDILVNVSKNLTWMRISNLVALLNCCAILVLGTLFYFVFYQEYKIIALVALSCFIAEAITLAVSKIGTYAVLPLSQAFVETGTPESSYFQMQGEFLYHGVYRTGYLIHMLFFSLGALLWYYLFYVSATIPMWLSVWGVAAVCLIFIPVLLTLYKRSFLPAMVLALPYAPYELILGIWLIVVGVN